MEAIFTKLADEFQSKLRDVFRNLVSATTTARAAPSMIESQQAQNTERARIENVPTAQFDSSVEQISLRNDQIDTLPAPRGCEFDSTGYVERSSIHNNQHGYALNRTYDVAQSNIRSYTARGAYYQQEMDQSVFRNDVLSRPIELGQNDAASASRNMPDAFNSQFSSSPYGQNRVQPMPGSCRRSCNWRTCTD